MGVQTLEKIGRVVERVKSLIDSIDILRSVGVKFVHFLL